MLLLPQLVRASRPLCLERFSPSRTPISERREEPPPAAYMPQRTLP